MGKSSNELVKSGGVLDHVHGHPNITPFTTTTTTTTSRSSKSTIAQTNPSYHQNSSSFPHFNTAKTTPPPPTCCSWARHYPHHQHNQGRGYTFGLKSSPLSEDNHHHHECMMVSWPPVSYTCSFCRREFRSAQALGGHMNIHRRDRARLRCSSSSALTAQFSPPNSTSTTPPTSLSKPISDDPNYCLNLNLHPNPNPSCDNIHSQNNTCTSNILTTTATPSQSISNYSTILELNPRGSGFISSSRARCVPSHQYSGRPVRPVERRRNSTNFDPKNFLAMRSATGGGGGGVRVNNNPEKGARSAGGSDDHNCKKSGRGEKLMVKPGLKKLDSIHRQSNYFCGNDGDCDHGLKKKKGVVLRNDDDQMMMIMGETRMDLEIGVGGFDDEDGEDDQGDVVDCGGDVCQVVGLDLELRLGYKF